MGVGPRCRAPCDAARRRSRRGRAAAARGRRAGTRRGGAACRGGRSVPGAAASSSGSRPGGQVGDRLARRRRCRAPAAARRAAARTGWPAAGAASGAGALGVAAAGPGSTVGAGPGGGCGPWIGRRSGRPAPAVRAARRTPAPTVTGRACGLAGAGRRRLRRGRARPSACGRLGQPWPARANDAGSSGAAWPSGSPEVIPVGCSPSRSTRVGGGRVREQGPMALRLGGCWRARPRFRARPPAGGSVPSGPAERRLDKRLNRPLIGRWDPSSARGPATSSIGSAPALTTRLNGSLRCERADRATPRPRARPSHRR